MYVPDADDTRSQKQRMLAGDLYNADDCELAAENLKAEHLLARYNNSQPGDLEGRRGVLQQLLGSLGDGTIIRPPLFCDYGYQIAIGARCFINFGLVALD